MELTNFEFKARTNDLEKLEKRLLELNPVFKGVDHQVDTYYNIPKGRLKLREGNIENALIYYNRPDIPDAKQADIILYNHAPGNFLKEILSEALGVKVTVEKNRKIYFIDNVKFHFDIITDLGTFIEVEVIDETGKYDIERLKEQCMFYKSFFGLNKHDLESKSYSDLILERINKLQPE